MRILTTLGLGNVRFDDRRALTAQSVEPPPLEQIERDMHRVLNQLSAFTQQVRQNTLVIPAELLFQARIALQPVERMAVAASRTIAGRHVLGTFYDVTGRGSVAGVEADPSKLGDALMTFERAGVHIAGWLHSHPGKGPGATHPSSIDRRQYADWTRHYGDQLVGFILVADGHVRLWGDAIEVGRIRTEIVGEGVSRIRGEQHVYRLDA